MMKKEREEEGGGAAMPPSLGLPSPSTASAVRVLGRAMEGASGFHTLRAPSPIVRTMSTRLDPPPPLAAAAPPPLPPPPPLPQIPEKRRRGRPRNCDRLLPPPGFGVPPLSACTGTTGAGCAVADSVYSRTVPIRWARAARAQNRCGRGCHIKVSQINGKAICVLSVLGAVQDANLLHSSSVILNHKGPLEIVRMLGAILTSDAPGFGCLSVTFACADCSVVGGVMAGPLIAATPATVGSFYNDAFRPNKTPKIIVTGYRVTYYPNSLVAVRNGIAHRPHSLVAIGTGSMHYPNSQVAIGNGSTHCPNSWIPICDGSTHHSSSQVTNDDGSAHHPNSQVMIGTGSTHQFNSHVTFGDGSTNNISSQVTVGDGSMHYPKSQVTVGDGSTNHANSHLTIDDGSSNNTSSNVTVGDGSSNNTNSYVTTGDENSYNTNCYVTFGDGSIHNPISQDTVGDGNTYYPKCKVSAGDGSFHYPNSNITVGGGSTSTFEGVNPECASCTGVEQDGSSLIDVKPSHMVV